LPYLSCPDHIPEKEEVKSSDTKTGMQGY